MGAAVMWELGDEPIWPCKPVALKPARRRRAARRAASRPILRYTRETVTAVLAAAGNDFTRGRLMLGVSSFRMNKLCRLYALNPVVRRGFGRVVPNDADALRALFAERFAEGSTLREIGEELGVTRERIRQLRDKYGINKEVPWTVRRRQRRALRIACGIQRLPEPIRLATVGQPIIPRNGHVFDVGDDRFIIRRAKTPWKDPTLSASHPGYWHFTSHGCRPDIQYIVYLTGNGECFVVPRAEEPRSPNIPAGPVPPSSRGAPRLTDWQRYRNAWPWNNKEGT